MALAQRPLYIGEFEGLRALMAWWVVFGHVANRIGISFSSELSLPWKVLVMTNIPVDIFIALSGFAIFSLLSKEWNGYGRYIAGRFFRIYPVYFICLVIGVFLFDWRVAQISTDPFVETSYIAATAALAESVA
ncbi:MAG TPA: acyltransferase family protein, partial [Sediminibacterium sp.]|nr:acyltransferase family protein [Sediminibacterium sp.]